MSLTTFCFEHNFKSNFRGNTADMLQDVVIDPPYPFSNEDDVFSGEKILQFCDDCDLFSDPHRTSEASSCSGCYGGDSGNGGGDNNGGKGSSENLCSYEDSSFSSSEPLMDHSTLSALLDEMPIPPANCSSPRPPVRALPSPLPPVSSFNSLSYLEENQQDHFPNIIANEATPNSYSPRCSSLPMTMPPISLLPSQLPQLHIPTLPSFEEDSMISTLSNYLGIDQPVPLPGSCSLLNQMGSASGIFFPANLTVPVTGREENYPKSLLVGADRPIQIPDIINYQPESGGLVFYGIGTGQQQMVCGSGVQMIGGEKQHLAATGCGSPTALVADVTALDDSTFKAGRISPEERKQKIHRYLKKRNERNFSKKIKYACRKTLADSRPRVRGRFAKNVELVETRRIISGNHEDDDDDDVTVKEEEIMDPNDILEQLNSFKCNYSLDAWM